MILQYLGTAAAEGIPALFCNCETCRRAEYEGGRNIRTRSQSIIDEKVLIDLPPDTFSHKIQYHLDLSRVKTLLVTHTHADHFHVESLAYRGYCYAHDMIVPKLSLYGSEAVLAQLQNANIQSCVRDTVVAVKNVPFQTFQEDDYRITSLPAKHMQTEQAYIYLIEKNGKKLLYANDSGWLKEEVLEYLQHQHLDAVSFDCTLMCSAHGEKGRHMGLPDNLLMRERLIKIGAVDSKTAIVVNHFSHNGGYLHEDFSNICAKENIQVAYDGFKLSI